MAGAELPDVLRLPLELISASAGIAMDLGGSAFKLLYRSKKDYKDGRLLVESEDGCGPIRLALFAREDLEGIIHHVDEECDLHRGPDCIIPVTGMGGNKFKDVLEERLNIKIKNTSEFPCLNVGLAWLLKNIPADELFIPYDDEVTVLAKKKYEDYTVIASDLVGQQAACLDELLAHQPVHDPSEPYLLILCGSATLMFKITPGAQPEFVEVMIMGGRFYMGAMRLLTGITDQNELFEMITAADGRTVDMYTAELTSSTTTDSYSRLTKADILLFPFGKTKTKPLDEMKNDDIAHSFTNVFCHNIAQTAHLVANKYGLKKIYFCGNFVNSSFVKARITSDLVVRSATGPEEYRVRPDFLRFGGYLVALGAFLNPELKSET